MGIDLYTSLLFLQAILDLSKPKSKSEDSSVQVYRDQAHSGSLKMLELLVKTLKRYVSLCWIRT